jgi:hypothetical protein
MKYSECCLETGASHKYLYKPFEIWIFRNGQQVHEMHQRKPTFISQIHNKDADSTLK